MRTWQRTDITTGPHTINLYWYKGILLTRRWALRKGRLWASQEDRKIQSPVYWTQSSPRPPPKKEPGQDPISWIPTHCCITVWDIPAYWLLSVQSKWERTWSGHSAILPTTSGIQRRTWWTQEVVTAWGLVKGWHLERPNYVRAKAVGRCGMCTEWHYSATCSDETIYKKTDFPLRRRDGRFSPIPSTYIYFALV